MAVQPWLGILSQRWFRTRDRHPSHPDAHGKDLIDLDHGTNDERARGGAQAILKADAFQVAVS